MSDRIHKAMRRPGKSVKEAPPIEFDVQEPLDGRPSLDMGVSPIDPGTHHYERDIPLPHADDDDLLAADDRNAEIRAEFDEAAGRGFRRHLLGRRTDNTWVGHQEGDPDKIPFTAERFHDR